MTNSEIYRFSDFTLENYIELLNLALQNYTFGLFTDAKIKRSILLRHDVEFSIPIALQMAEIEAKLGVKSTYFIQLHSEFYNAFQKDSILAFKRIMLLGHKIGLHFDSHYWNISSENELEENIAVDKKTLEIYTNAEINVFSFHNNNSFTLSCRKDKYQGLLNVYSEYFRNNYGYNADSLGYWRFERLEDRLKEAKEDNLQILIHDGMWQSEILAPRQRVFKVIDEHASNMKLCYDSFLKNIGVKNIDWNNIYE